MIVHLPVNEVPFVYLFRQTETEINSAGEQLIRVKFAGRRKSMIILRLLALAGNLFLK